MQNAISSWSFPTSANIGGKEYGIKSDYRAVIKIFTALNDYELLNEDRFVQCSVILGLFYEDYKTIPHEHWQEALDYMKDFIDAGISDEGKSPKLMDWEQDAPILIPAINKVLNTEIRAANYLHWWTFLGAYMGIEDGLFSNVISIRQKKVKGKKLEKWEQEFYKANKAIIDFQKKEQRSTEEKEALRAYFGFKK